jgi:hypothetical protein
VPLAFLTLLVVTVALAMWFAAVNVRYRDVGHLLGIASGVVLATPIVYASYQAQQLAEGGEWLGIRGSRSTCSTATAVIRAHRALRVRPTGRARAAGPVRRGPRLARRRARRRAARLDRPAAFHLGRVLQPLGGLAEEL